MGFRYRDSDRFYTRGAPHHSRNEDHHFYQDRRGPHPYYNRDRRPEERRFMKEIATKALFLSAKKFYLDIVEGSSGKLLKLSEVAQTGQKSKMMMDIETAVEFHDKISDFCDFLSDFDKSTALTPAGDKDRSGYRCETIKNDVMVRDQRRYYLDLMENHRGMFLKVTMKPPTMDRIQLVFPASGLPEVRDALTELLSEHGTSKKRRISESEDCIVTEVVTRDRSSEAIVVPDEPCYEGDCDDFIEDDIIAINNISPGVEKRSGEPVVIVDDNKMDCKDRSFQFEVKTNETGTYLSITESSAKFRSVINVPQKCWREFVSSVEAKLRELNDPQHGTGSDRVGGFRTPERSDQVKA